MVFLYFFAILSFGNCLSPFFKTKTAPSVQERPWQDYLTFSWQERALGVGSSGFVFPGHFLHNKALISVKIFTRDDTSYRIEELHALVTSFKKKFSGTATPYLHGVLHLPTTSKEHCKFVKKTGPHPGMMYTSVRPLTSSHELLKSLESNRGNRICGVVMELCPGHDMTTMQGVESSDLISRIIYSIEILHSVRVLYKKGILVGDNTLVNRVLCARRSPSAELPPLEAKIIDFGIQGRISPKAAASEIIKASRDSIGDLLLGRRTTYLLSRGNDFDGSEVSVVQGLTEIGGVLAVEYLRDVYPVRIPIAQVLFSTLRTYMFGKTFPAVSTVKSQLRGVVEKIMFCSSFSVEKSLGEPRQVRFYYQYEKRTGTGEFTVDMPRILFPVDAQEPSQRLAIHVFAISYISRVELKESGKGHCVKMFLVYPAGKTVTLCSENARDMTTIMEEVSSVLEAPVLCESSRGGVRSLLKKIDAYVNGKKQKTLRAISGL